MIHKFILCQMSFKQKNRVIIFCMKRFGKKLIIWSSITGLLVLGGLISLYKWGIPNIVNNSKAISFIQNKAGSALNADIIIDSPYLKTGKSIAFTLKSFKINKNGKKLLEVKNIDTLFDLQQLFFGKKIIVKKLLAEEIYADIDDLMSIIPKTEKKKKEKKESFIELDMYNVLMGVKKTRVLYDAENYSIDFQARHMIFDRTQSRKFLHFDFDLDINRGNHKISVSANDMNRFYMENKKAYIVNFPINIDDSEVLINAEMDNKMNYELNISAKNYNAADIANAVTSDIFIANGSEMLAPIGDIKGRVDFNLKLTKKLINGEISVKNVECKVIPLLNMPVKATKGTVLIGNSDIKLKDFEGYYNNKHQNTLKMRGEVKDYKKTCDTKIVSHIFVTNDFFKNYLSKMLNSPIGLVGESDSILVLKTKNSAPIDILWYFLLKENQGFKFGEQSMVLKDYKTLFKVDLSVIKNILKINTINYYITNELKRGIKPLITINGNIDMADNMKIKDLSLDIPKPLPSEFLNFLLCQKVFKKGLVSGHMDIKDIGPYPIMSGEFALDKVIIPAKRLFIKSGKLIANGNLISIKTNGKLRRENYTFDGHIQNALKLPIIVKDVNLKVDNIDVEKILTQPQTQTSSHEGQEAKQALVSTGEEDEESMEIPVFPKGLLVIEKCSLNLLKGVYKEISFGNIHADMTLDKNGILNLKSNRFDIADGISTLKINADLVNRNYYMRLGVKDVDSNIMASAILGLPRQISGKAKGLIELNTDKTLNLNGDIKFKINNGTIEQVGYVEYILKVASLFRNPLAMFSPTTVFDLVNIPDGRFDEISGEMKLKDNVIRRISIKSTAEDLATFITGRYDLTNNDASLRIYTKFSNKGKGFASILRNISLNSLASKLSISSRNDSNYYSSELAEIPELKNNEKEAQVFLTKIDGDVVNFNFLSSLKRIK